MAGDRALADSNVLISAVDRSRAAHLAALALLESERDVVVSPQVAREFLVVCTRPTIRNGLGHDIGIATANLNELLAGRALLTEDETVARRLVRLVAEGRGSGEQIHDANIVATALTSGVATIITANRRHFERFADLVEIEELA